MKKFLLGIILPVLTLITLIGTGFATWYFDKDLSTNATANVGVSVEKYAQVGYITVSPGTYKIKLDQPTYDNAGAITAQNITLYEGTNTNTAVTLTGTYNQGVANNGKTDVQADYTQIADFTITVTLTANLAKYITLDTSVSGGWTTTDNLTFTKQAIQTNGTANNTLSLTSADFKYATRTGSGNTFNPVGAPTTLAEYKTMIEELVTNTNAQNITVKFDAKIQNPNQNKL